jgi:photosystem II stability/assembly factor-like uncharacterized protein
MRTLFFIFIFIGLLHLNLGAQEDAAQEQVNFFELQSQMNDYYEQNPNASGYKQWKRMEWFYEPRVFPDGDMDALVGKTYQAQEKYFKEHPGQRSTHGDWEFLGPTDHINPGQFAGGKGRINSIAIHPTNDQIIYAAASSGGLWKTEDGGSIWQNKSPRIPLLSIADVVIDPSNTNKIYIATGDPNPCSTCIDVSSSHSQTGASSFGILKSDDGGSTWLPTSVNYNTIPSGVRIFKILINPDSSNIQMAASSAGILRTTNGWQSHTTVNSNLIFDLEFKPGNTAYVYAGGSNSFWRSKDGGVSWAIISDPVLSSVFGSTRTKIAVSTAFNNGVYFMKVSNNASQGILRSLGSGAANTWTVVDTSTSRFGGAGFYNLALCTKPNDFNTLFTGMVLFGRTTSGGTLGGWNVFNAGHPDIHDLQMRNGILYCANDGGLYKSMNDGDTWTQISQGIGNTEIYRMAGTPQNSNLYTIGCQDNGTMKRASTSTVFNTIGGADGMTTMIDYTNENNIIISGQNGFFFKTNTGGPAQINITPGNAGAWVTPGIMDPVNPNILFIGKDTVYRSTDQGNSWAFFTGPTLNNLNVLAQGVDNRNRLYASRGSFIWRHESALTATGDTTWTNINNGLPSFFITDIVVNPNNSDEVYITYSGYDSIHKIYYTDNGGMSWTNISGSLPAIPINCMAYHDNGSNNDPLYIGTDIGVFYRDNQIGDWVYFSNYLPSVSVTDLYINDQNNTIAAATYGRGLWRSDLYSSCIADQTIMSILLGNTIYPIGGVRYYSASNTITSTAEHFKDVGTEIHYGASNFIDLKDGFEFGGLGLFIGKAGVPCPSGN